MKLILVKFQRSIYRDERLCSFIDCVASGRFGIVIVEGVFQERWHNGRICRVLFDQVVGWCILEDDEFL